MFKYAAAALQRRWAGLLLVMVVLASGLAIGIVRSITRQLGAELRIGRKRRVVHRDSFASADSRAALARWSRDLIVPAGAPNVAAISATGRSWR